MSQDLHHQAGSLTYIISAVLDLPLLTETNLPLRRTQVDPGELEAGDGLKLVAEPVQEGTYRLVARVNRIGGCIPTQAQADGHDASGDCSAYAARACHPATETGGDAGDDFRSNIQVLGDRQQDALGSVEAGGVE
jgi:hypothetical protein